MRGDADQTYRLDFVGDQDIGQADQVGGVLAGRGRVQDEARPGGCGDLGGAQAGGRRHFQLGQQDGALRQRGGGAFNVGWREGSVGAGDLHDAVLARVLHQGRGHPCALLGVTNHIVGVDTFAVERF